MSPQLQIRPNKTKVTEIFTYLTLSLTQVLNFNNGRESQTSHSIILAYILSHSPAVQIS